MNNELSACESEKRQGTGALQDASRTREPWHSRQRLGVRRPSAAFRIKLQNNLLPFPGGGHIPRESMNDDLTLLREFAASNSEAAFAALVVPPCQSGLFRGPAAGARPASGRGDHPGRLHHSGAQGGSIVTAHRAARLAVPHGALCRRRCAETTSAAASSANRRRTCNPS